MSGGGVVRDFSGGRGAPWWRAGNGPCLALLGLALAGCGGIDPPARPNAKRVMPPMPRMAPRMEGDVPRRSEAEVIALARHRAREGDATGAVAALREIADGDRRREVSVALARQLGEHDPRSVEPFLGALPAGRTQVQAIAGVAGDLAPRDRAAAMTWALEARAAPSGPLIRQAVADQLGRGDARAAVDALRARPAEVGRDELLALTAAAWARDDAAAALAWARDVPEEPLKQRLISSVGFAIAQTDPKSAMDVAELLPRGRDRWVLVGAAAQTWIAKDPRGATAWVRSLPAGEAREAAYAGFDAGLGVPTSRRMVNAPGTRSGSSRTRGGVAAGEALRGGDLAAFELWLSLQPPGLTREEAILEYVRQRGTSNPSAIGQWLASLPASPARDQAVSLHLESVLATSPRDAAHVLRTLPRSERTDERVERTARRFLLTNPDAAERWLEEMNVPEFRREELRRGAGL